MSKNSKIEAQYTREEHYCDKCGNSTKGIFITDDGRYYCFGCFYDLIGAESIGDVMSHIVD